MRFRQSLPLRCLGPHLAVEVYSQSDTTGQLIIYGHYRVSEEKQLPICGGIREHELALEGLVGFVINGYGGMNTPDGRNHLDKITEVQTSKDDLGNDEGFG